MKKCPFCAEEIQDEAVVCRFCGHKIQAVGIDQMSANKNLLIIFGLIILSLLCAAGILALI